MKSKNLEGFLNIPFGTSKEVLLELIKEYEGVIDEKNNDSETLIMINMIFNGDQTQFILFKFFENKFWKAVVYLSTDRKLVLKTYEEIKRELNNKYFFTETTYESKSRILNFLKLNFLALQLSRIYYLSKWSFDNSPYKDNCIILEIDKGFDLKLTYLSESIEGEFFKNKNKDY